jgi:hypothetical protein
MPGTESNNSTEIRVSEHFPRVPKECEQVADKFFSCLHENGKQPQGVKDSEAGNKALHICKTSVLAYNSCVDKATKKKPKKLFRVPEAYRVRDE